MSRSYKKHVYTGFTCATSEKYDKRVANRKLRKRQKQAIRNGDILPVMKEVSNIFNFVKDGKQVFDKDDEYYNKLRRK